MEEFRQVALSDCHESPLNTRRHFDEGALKDLTESIVSKGVLTPILARPRDAGGVEILAGARRCRAARAAGLAEVPARIREFTDDEALEVVVIENLQRQDVNALEEAEGYKALLERPGYDVAAIANKVGKAESYVYQRLKLADLVEPARNAFLDDRLTVSHAILIARLQPDDQVKALGLAFRDDWSSGKSVKVAVRVGELAEKIEAEILRDLKRAPFDPKDAELLPAAGACTTCPKRTGATPALFPDITKGDTCTDGSCFKAKVAAHLDHAATALAAKGAPPLRLSAEYSVQARGKVGKGILASGQYRSAKAKTCPHVQKGIVVDVGRYNADELGKVLTVCAEPSCKVHHPAASTSGYGGGAYNSEQDRARQRREQAKAARQVEINRRVFAAMVTFAPTKLGRVELERLAGIAFTDDFMLDDEMVYALAPLLGVEIPETTGSAANAHKIEQALVARISKVDDKALARFMAVLPLVEGIDSWRGHADLHRAAAEYGVDVATITATVDAELKAKADAEKAAARAKAAKPGKKAAKRAAATARACESCRCTEDAACPDGCAWDPTFQSKGRWVCTTPACVKSATARGAKKAKKPAAATKRAAKKGAKK